MKANVGGIDRVARIAALEKGLAERVQLVWSDPWNHDPALLAVHPQLRIPVLVTDEGQAIAESLLIAQYLDQIGTGPAPSVIKPKQVLPAPVVIAPQPQVQTRTDGSDRETANGYMPKWDVA